MEIKIIRKHERYQKLLKGVVDLKLKTEKM
jgi:hypothetical protein